MGMVLNTVRFHRKINRITQGELAEAIGVTRQSITSIELGMCVPALETAFKLAKYFNKKIEDIFILGEESKL